MLGALAFWLAVSATPAAAGPAVPTGDFVEIRAVVNRQLDAFRRDDAPGAFALVSPGVQQAFGTPKRLLDVVRAAYRAGGVWLAYYAMQRQNDGSWRANGCHLAQPASAASRRPRSASTFCAYCAEPSAKAPL